MKMNKFSNAKQGVKMLCHGREDIPQQNKGNLGWHRFRRNDWAVATQFLKPRLPITIRAHSATNTPEIENNTES